MNITFWWKRLVEVHKSISLKQRILYNLRWQGSTPTLAIFSSLTVAVLTRSSLGWPTWEEWAGAVVANFIGANMFIYIDKLIFKKDEKRRHEVAQEPVAAE